MNTARYDRLSRYLHWASAAVIIWASLTGFYLATLEPASNLRAWLSWFNVSLTTAFTPIFVARIIHATRTRKPASLDVPRWQQRLAHLVHALLYAMTSVVLASGEWSASGGGAASAGGRTSGCGAASGGNSQRLVSGLQTSPWARKQSRLLVQWSSG